jgi:hypothetical protein
MKFCTVILLLLPLLHAPSVVSAQRFMRRGFSNQEDFGAEMALDDKEAAVDMTREMFLMQDMQWQLQPVTDWNKNIPDRKIRRHIQKYLGKPVELKLYKKRGKYGLRAVGRMQNGTTGLLETEYYQYFSTPTQVFRLFGGSLRRRCPIAIVYRRI